VVVTEARYMLAAVGFQSCRHSVTQASSLRVAKDKVTTLVETRVTNHLRGLVDSDQFEVLIRYYGRMPQALLG
jgi:hypothetical protein